MANKRALYVGGLPNEINTTILQAAFIPFGPLKKVEIPVDNQKGTIKGFAFVEFEDVEDAEEAQYNMNGAELMGRILNVKTAIAQTHSLSSNKALWSTEEFHKKAAADANDASSVPKE